MAILAAVVIYRFSRRRDGGTWMVWPAAALFFAGVAVLVAVSYRLAGESAGDVDIFLWSAGGLCLAAAMWMREPQDLRVIMAVSCPIILVVAFFAPS
ncbi:hypothetical protein HY380_02265 [Candidatus Saccharibacteria bacterium]|nr:hypothetical protein [Candidatus Saccharibacteria bacterium]